MIPEIEPESQQETSQTYTEKDTKDDVSEAFLDAREEKKIRNNEQKSMKAS